MIKADGWKKNCIWDHSSYVAALYQKRCEQEVGELTCHAQAVDILKPHLREGDVVLDVGCGSGYFFHSFRNRKLSIAYHGIDASETLLGIGKKCLPKFGLPEDRLHHLRIEDLDAEVDHITCINVISNTDHFYRPLERMLKSSKRTVLLRESLSEASSYLYVKDKYLDTGVDLSVPVNTYSIFEVSEFIRSHGFEIQIIQDIYTNGQPQLVIDYPHYWKFILAVRKE